MTRKIVYLDHSVLSRLAKDPSSPLLDTLKQLVQADRAVFPFSWTHHHEAELDDRLEDKLQRIGAELSRGIQFHIPSQIVSAQSRRAYIAYAERDDERALWTDAFQNDPRGPLEDSWFERTRSVGVRTHPIDEEARRHRKVGFASTLAETRGKRPGSASYDDVRESYLDEAVRGYFIEPWKEARSGRTTPLGTAMLDFAGGAADEAFGISAQRTPLESMEGCVSFLRFLASDDCRRIPFVHLESSILASLEFDERTRPYGRGDLYDVETWAAYLPYVDLAVADSNMHQVLTRRGLAAKYGCRVFRHRDLQDLIALLAA